LNGQPSNLQAGPENIEIAKMLLARYHIPIIGEDTGGSAGRKVLFHTHTGRLQVSPMGRKEFLGQSLAAPPQAVNTSKVIPSDLRTIIAIGSSTGGTEALKKVLCALPERIPPVVIAQHIPAVYSKAFADRMNSICPFEVKEAEDGDEVKASRVLIAPGGKQMKVAQSSRGLCVRVTDDAPVNRHKPSVDYLFHSVASVIGSKAIGVILTGMGADGSKGLLEMKRKGARTIAQDEESSVVYGMPKMAFEIGAADKVVSLSEIPRQIVKLLEKKAA
jgi:two-component system chemotaxis response regulator CheB